MNNQQDSPRYSADDTIQECWNEGYAEGLGMFNKLNPYQYATIYWEAYEAGYEEGWLDS